MTEQELTEFMTENAPQLKKAVAERMIAQLAENYRWSMPDVLNTLVKEFMDKEIVPDVKKYLADNKGPILEAVIKSCSTIGDEVSKVMLKQAMEQLQGYRGGEVIKAIFGVR